MYILVSTNSRDRNLSCRQFEARAQAWRAMRDELVAVNGGEFAKAYEKDRDENGYVFRFGWPYGIKRNEAWANADGDGLLCDWKIFRVDADEKKEEKLCQDP